MLLSTRCTFCRAPKDCAAPLRRISPFSHVKLSLTPAEFDKTPSRVKAELKWSKDFWALA